jgi:acyl dehydratase
MRDGGGCGSTQFEAPRPYPIPARPPDAVVESPTLSQSGLIYRLTGDRNPLHADPAVARALGFDRPILHGSCSYGIVGHALLAHLCDYDASRLRRMDVQYSAPLYPGETVATEIWSEGKGVYAFRASSRQRGTLVLNNGRAEIQ